MKWLLGTNLIYDFVALIFPWNCLSSCLQCFDAVGWVGHLACRKWVSGGMLAWLCLGQGADLYMAQLMPLPLTVSCSSKYSLVLPLWCRLTWIVPEKSKRAIKRLCVVCMPVFVKNAPLHEISVIFWEIQCTELILKFISELLQYVSIQTFSFATCHIF